VAIIIPSPPPQLHLLYDFDFNISDQGFLHLIPIYDSNSCYPALAVDDWEWGTPSNVGPVPGELTCDEELLSNCWATQIDSEYTTRYGYKSSSRLLSPCIEIPDTCGIGVWLEICHWYDIETDYDGGNVVVFQPCYPYNGDPTEVLPVIAGKNYDRIINVPVMEFTCLVDSEPGFTGHQYGWFKSYFDLTPYAGSSIRFGFDFGVNNFINYPGWYIKWAKVWCVEPPTVVEENQPLPIQGFKFFGAKPNPTGGITRISFAIPEPTYVELKIYDATGRIVSTPFRGKLPKGVHNIRWNGLDSKGIRVPQGVYFYRLKAGEYKATGKLILILP